MKTICSKSWTDVNIDFKNRLLRHCCRSEPYDFPENLAVDFLNNSENIQQRRIESLAGIESQDCIGCWRDYAKGNSAYKDWMNRWDDQFVTAHKQTLNDSYTSYVDIELDATCDMSCLYCSSICSSKIAQEEGVVVEDKSKDFDYEVFKQWVGLTLNRDDLKSSEVVFNFLGGEPTASKKFYDIIDFLQAQSLVSKRRVVLEVCTNCNSKPFLIDKLFRAIDASKITWGISVSNESYGADAEMIRDGMDWKRFAANFSRYVLHPKVKYMNLAPTVNAFSIISFADYIRWVHAMFSEHSPTKKFYWVGNYVSHPDELDIANLPEKYKIYIDDAIQALQTTKPDNLLNYDEFLGFLQQMKERIGSNAKDDYIDEIESFMAKKIAVKKKPELSVLLDKLRKLQ